MRAARDTSSGKASRAAGELGRLIAANLEDLRQRYNLSKKEMAARMGLDPSNYQKLIRQKRPKLRFNHEQLSYVASAFNISPAVLVEDGRRGGAREFLTRMRSVLTDRQAQELCELMTKAGRSGMVETALGVLNGLLEAPKSRRRGKKA